jgi:hypothetical protein
MKSYYIAALFLVATLASAHAASAKDTINFSDTSVVVVNPNVTRISQDGRSLEVDLESAKFANIFRLKSGVLKGATNYVIRFRYRIDSPMTEDIFLATVKEPKDPFFHFGIRSERDSQVVNPLRFRALSRKMIARTERVFVPAIANDFIFHGDAYHVGAKGVIEDLRITQAISDGFKPLFNTEDISLDALELPTGAKEFEVAMPDNPKGEVVYAEKFGVSANSADNTASIRKALEYCRTTKAAKLVLPKGTLRFGSEAGPDGSVMRLHNFRDFEFDGNGALLKFYTDLGKQERGQWNYFDIRHSERLRLRNFSVDWDWEKDPVGAMVEVIAVNGEDVDFRFSDYDDFPRRDLRIAEVRTMDPASRTFLVEDAHHHHYEFYNGKRIPQITWLSGNIIRVRDNGGIWEKERMHLFKPGRHYRLLQYYYDARVFHNAESSDISLEDINVYSVPGFMMQSRDLVKNWQLLRVRVAPPENAPERVVTCTADTYDHERGLGNMKMIDCIFSFGHDDAINMLEFNYPAVKTGTHTIRTRNLKTSASTLRPGDPIEFRRGDWSPTGVTSKLKSLRPLESETQPEDAPWVQYDRKSQELTFEDPVPDAETGLVLVNRAYNSGNVILRNCRFDNIAGRGFVLQVSNATIENCHFRAIHGFNIRSGYTFRAWTEGAGVDNVVIRNCTFEQVEPGSWDFLKSTFVVNGYALAQDPHSDMKLHRGLFSNILMENNTFIDTYGMAAYISSAESIIIRNNTFIDKTPRDLDLSYRGSFFVGNSKNIFIVGNRYIKSDLVKNPGVYFDPDDIENLVVKGNRLE